MNFFTLSKGVFVSGVFFVVSSGSAWSQMTNVCQRVKAMQIAPPKRAVSVNRDILKQPIPPACWKDTDIKTKIADFKECGMASSADAQSPFDVWFKELDDARQNCDAFQAYCKRHGFTEMNKCEGDFVLRAGLISNSNVPEEVTKRNYELGVAQRKYIDNKCGLSNLENMFKSCMSKYPKFTSEQDCNSLKASFVPALREASRAWMAFKDELIKFGGSDPKLVGTGHMSSYFSPYRRAKNPEIVPEDTLYECTRDATSCYNAAMKATTDTKAGNIAAHAQGMGTEAEWAAWEKAVRAEFPTFQGVAQAYNIAKTNRDAANKVKAEWNAKGCNDSATLWK